MSTLKRFPHFAKSAILGLCLFASLAFDNHTIADDLQEGFAQPPDSAKPHVWWHWMNGNITKEGITADLEAMADVGIGGAQIFEPSESIPHGPIQFNSPQWRELVLFAAKEARRLGLELGIHNCAGWSSSGGRPAEANLFEHLKNGFANPKDTPGLPRALLIGDSISIGYTIPVREYLNAKANVHRAPENCQHTAHGIKNIKKWIGEGKWDVIHFNWGIWDTHYIDGKTGEIWSGKDAATMPGHVHIRHTPEEYRRNLLQLVSILKTTGARLIWASSTPILSREGERFNDIVRYNRVAESVMKEQGVEIDDLYNFTLPNAAKWQNPDQCHFNDLGNKNLGRQVGNAILDGMNKRSRDAAGKDSIAMSKVERCEETSIAGRKVVRYEHESADQWNYAVPQRDCFFLAYPEQSQDIKAPLRVVLHSAGGSGESEMPSILKKHGDRSSYELFLDCRRNQASDWWWGYDSLRKMSDSLRSRRCPTEKRVLATVAWTIAKFPIDADRVYLSGISMGGSGSLGIGLCRGDVFAAISVTVPAGTGHVLLRMNGDPLPDPPPLFNFSSQNDSWAAGQEDLIRYCRKNHYFLAFAWGPLGHINDSSLFNAAVAEFPWLSIRRNEAYPVFINASTDNVYPGFRNTKSADQTGQIDGVFRWKNIADATDRFAMEIRLVREDELRRPIKLPTKAFVDVAIRRMQNFRCRQDKIYCWRLTAKGELLQSGTLQVGVDCLPIIHKLVISQTPALLEIQCCR